MSIHVAGNPSSPLSIKRATLIVQRVLDIIANIDSLNLLTAKTRLLTLLRSWSSNTESMKYLIYRKHDTVIEPNRTFYSIHPEAKLVSGSYSYLIVSQPPTPSGAKLRSIFREALRSLQFILLCFLNTANIEHCTISSVRTLSTSWHSSIYVSP